MNNRRIFLIALFLSVLSFAHAEPKAYDLVKYSGKVGGITIAFDFADGYPEASEMRVTEAASGKTTKFHLEDSGKVLFVPEKAGGAVKSVTLKMDLEDRAPAKVAGTFVADGKTVSFTLTKSKQGK